MRDLQSRLDNRRVKVSNLSLQIDGLHSRSRRALKHHTRIDPDGIPGEWCEQCDVVWPCETAAALLGVALCPGCGKADCPH